MHSTDAHLAASVVAMAAGMLSASVARADTAGCPPTVELHGDAEPVRAVRQALLQRGILERSAGVCQPTRVTVLTRGTELSIHVEDPWGRSADRILVEPETVAVFIESWARAPHMTSSSPIGRLRTTGSGRS